jgi:hypothetical protein
MKRWRSRAEHVQPALGEKRALRIWEGVARAQQSRRRRHHARWGLGLAAASLCVLFVLRRSAPNDLPTVTSATPDLAGMIVDTARRGQDLLLPGGTRLDVAPDTRFTIVNVTAEGTRVLLDHGRLECHLTPGRRLVVETEPHHLTLEMTGTRFLVEAVSAAPGSVTVQVEDGRVDVRRSGGESIAHVGPGETWRSDPELARLAASSPDEDAEPALAADPPAPLATSAAPHVVTPDAARALFERGDSARSAGRLREAAEAFDQLWRRFPRDPRASLAALEAGRLRLDPGALHDPRAAAEDFAFARTHGEGAFREDAAAVVHGQSAETRAR